MIVRKYVLLYTKYECKHKPIEIRMVMPNPNKWKP